MHSNHIARASARVAALLAFVSTVSAGQEMKMAPDPLGISMNRAGSGSTWTPDAISLPSLHFMRGNWDYMVHGFVFGQYTNQGGPRGESQFGSLNWGMFMATHELAGGRFSFRTMLSLDPLTVTDKGYPLLLQTGETYDGARLRDRQHPHDFWMELGATYERALTNSLGFSLYVAPSGEPALSPVAFMHRQSAMDNPFAPLGHHWQDATHVSYGVLTGGLFGNKWKIEGSIFNGREPDQHRFNIERIKLDSYSGRLTLNPTENWSATLGYGFLKSPEIIEPDENMHRFAASLLHGTRIGSEGQIASTFVIGTNIHDHVVGPTHQRDLVSMMLLETDAVLDARNTILGRLEFGAKSLEDLVIAPEPGQALPAPGILAFTAGYIREVVRIKRATIGLGAMGTINHVSGQIADDYGSTNPKAITVFLRLRPSFPKGNAMAGMHH